MYRSIRIFSAAVALTVLGSAAAGADNGFPIETTTVNVAYGDLDLGTDAGAQAMLARIEKAAKRACGTMPERDRFYRSNPEFVAGAFRQCTRQAVRDAVAQLQAPLVSRAYAAANGVTDTDVAAH